MRCHKETRHEWLTILCLVEQRCGKNFKQDMTCHTEARYEVPNMSVEYYIITINKTWITTEMGSHIYKMTERKSNRKQKGNS